MKNCFSSLVGIFTSLIFVGCMSSPSSTNAEPSSEPQAPSYSTDFEADPFEAGWYWDKPAWAKKAGKPGTADWVDRTDSAGGKCLEVTDGMWRSPKIELEPLSFAEVRIESKAGASGYWGLLSYDADGEEIPASPYSQIPGSEAWVWNESAVLIPQDAVYSRVLLWPRKSAVRADNISVTPISRRQALRIADRTYSEVPPVDPEYSDATRAGIKHTLKTLENGGEVRILLLGDSVSNDMANSNFQLLLERRFEGARVTLLNKVGSGAGASAFLENERIGKMIETHRPDLVMFGGISNTPEDIPTIRRLAERVMQHDGTEFLVFTGTLLMPKYWENFEQSEKKKARYRESIKKMGAEDGFAVCDLGGAWERYAQSCGKPVAYFRRDHHHANERGKQVFGRLLAAFFAPIE